MAFILVIRAILVTGAVYVANPSLDFFQLPGNLSREGGRELFKVSCFVVWVWKLSGSRWEEVRPMLAGNITLGGGGMDV